MATPSITWRRGHFLVIALLLHIPLFVYPVLRIGDWLGVPLAISVLVLMPVLLSQYIARVVLRSTTRPWGRLVKLAADFVLGISPLLLLGLLAVEPIVLLGIKGKDAAAWLLIVTMFAAFVGVLFASFPVVKRVRFSSSKLTKPVRFVQISDVHIGSRSPQFLAGVVTKINGLNPDFLCITGDFIDATGVDLEALRSLRSLRVPVYFCIGNHEKYEDLGDIVSRLSELGVKVLRNRAILFRDDMQVIGIDDMEDPAQVAKQLPRITLADDRFKLLLYHRPRGLEAGRKHGIDLILSGHTHNGQIFPFNYIVRRVFEQLRGMYQSGGCRQYVNQGTGTWGPVLRIGSVCEITLFDLEVDEGHVFPELDNATQIAG